VGNAPAALGRFVSRGLDAEGPGGSLSMLISITRVTPAPVFLALTTGVRRTRSGTRHRREWRGALYTFSFPVLSRLSARARAGRKTIVQVRRAASEIAPRQDRPSDTDVINAAAAAALSLPPPPCPSPGPLADPRRGISGSAGSAGSEGRERGEEAGEEGGRGGGGGGRRVRIIFGAADERRFAVMRLANYGGESWAIDCRAN